MSPRKALDGPFDDRVWWLAVDFCSAYARQRLCKGKVPITTSTVVEDRRSGIDPAVDVNLLLQLLTVYPQFLKFDLI